MSWAADWKAPEELLRDQIAETPFWRAIVAAKNADWATVAATVDAGSVAEGEAKDRIVYGNFNNDPACGPVVDRPRACIRQLEDDQFDRVSNAGMDYSGSLVVVFELFVPQSLKTFAERYIDFKRKISAIMFQLANQPRQHGRLDITGTVSMPIGEMDERVDEGFFWVGDFVVSFQGAT